jgi:hypothetical protein
MGYLITTSLHAVGLGFESLIVHLKQLNKPLYITLFVVKWLSCCLSKPGPTVCFCFFFLQVNFMRAGLKKKSVWIKLQSLSPHCRRIASKKSLILSTNLIGEVFSCRSFCYRSVPSQAMLNIFPP